MAKFAAAISEHPDSAEAIGEVIGSVTEQLGGDRPDLAICFFSPSHVQMARKIGVAIQEALAPRALLGTSMVAVIAGDREIEGGPAISLFAARLPSTELVTVGLEAISTPDGAAIIGWPTDPPNADLLLLFADPYTFPVDRMLHTLNAEVPGLRVIGGLASAATGPEGNRLILDSVVTSEGAVGVFINGGIEVKTVVSQGCRPVGDPFVVTRADENIIYELGGKPALERLQEILDTEPAAERKLMMDGLHIGQVVDEQRDMFGRGDFLVRNVVGADKEEGSISVGDLIDVGRTVQFHVRDSDAADEDLHELLAGAKADAALLFTCNGRGREFFGSSDHDAAAIEEAIGPLPLAGGFCAGELGPVGGQNFLHGFTASIALIRE